MFRPSENKNLSYYFSKLCGFCAPVTFLLRSNKISYEPHEVDLMNFEHRTEEYKKINPFQKVPTLIDGEFILFESTVVLRYICNSKEIPENWYPKDSKGRALVDLYFDWHAANVGLLVQFTYTKLGIIHSKDSSLVEAKATSEKLLKEIEDIFLSRRKFLASNDKPTIADLAIMWHLRGLENAGIEFSAKVQEYRKNVLEEPLLREDIETYIQARNSNDFEGYGQKKKALLGNK